MLKHTVSAVFANKQKVNTQNIFHKKDEIINEALTTDIELASLAIACNVYELC